jgi:spore coat protein CotF
MSLWTCATNDKRLHRECSQQGVNSIWGLKIMVELVANHQLTPTDASNIVKQMSAINPFVNERVIQGFQKELVSCHT